MPQPVRPMLATAGPQPRGEGWTHEVKWDGMRALVDVSPDGVVAWSRSGRDVTAAFPEVDGLDGAVADVLLDGELIALDAGVPSFARLADRIHVSDRGRAEALAVDNPVTFMVFDLLRLYGVDLTPRPLSERRRSLESLSLPPGVSVSPSYADGPALLRATREQGLEGVVAKRLDSAYHPGRRSKDWVKTPHRTDRSVVVGGWRWDTGSRSRIGAVLVGIPDADGGLPYAGRVGSGIGGREAKQLFEALEPLQRSGSPFSTAVPSLDARGAVWVEPTAVVDVSFLQRTADGRLRQPVFRRLRTDVGPGDVEVG